MITSWVVGSAVASESSGPRFESSHWQNLD